MNSIQKLTIKRGDDKVIFSLDTNAKSFTKIMIIMYVMFLGYFNLRLFIPSLVEGEASLTDVFIGNAIVIGTFAVFIVFIPKLLKYFGRNIHKTSDFITLDKVKNTLYFRNEDIAFPVNSIKEIKLNESRNMFGLSYYLVVVTDDMQKSINPPMLYKFASEIKDVLSDELKKVNTTLPQIT